MFTRRLIAAFCASCAITFLLADPLPLYAGDVVLNQTGPIKAYAIDQPELYSVIYDGANVITSGGEPVLLETFVDTGASGFVISALNAQGLYDTPSLGWTSNDYIGTFSETGIAGNEPGHVTRPFGVGVANAVPGVASSVDVDQVVNYGQYNLWTRDNPGPGEVYDLGGFSLTDPVNIVGMPVISQRVMVMDPTVMETQGRLGTQLLQPGSAAIPATNVTIQMQLQNFVTPNGTATPSHADNPVLPAVTVRQGSGGSAASSTGTWLFDTGAASSFMSFAQAKQVGLMQGYDNLADFMANYDGRTAVVGGIGPDAITVPILTLDELSVPTKEGFNLVWRNVDMLVSDVAGLDGVFGMNLLVPAVTIDASSLDLTNLGVTDEDLASQQLLQLLGLLTDQSPGYFNSIVFDATDSGNVVLRLQSDAVPEPASMMLLASGAAMFLRRRRP